MNKIKLTVILPVRNEEKNLPFCFSAIGHSVDQIIVIDSNSIDKTVEIAKNHGAEVFQFDWNGQFPKKRNWALQNVEIRNEWILFLDADEYINESFISEISQKIKDPQINGYVLTYTNYFMGKQLKHGDSFKKLALFRKGTGEYECIKEDSWSHLDMEVHEHLTVSGKVGTIKTAIKHNDFKGLEQYINRHNAYSSWEAKRFLALKKLGFDKLNKRQKIKYTAMQLGVLPIVYFLGSYIFKLGFLDGKTGYYFAKYKAHYFLQIQTKIKELV